MSIDRRERGGDTLWSDVAGPEYGRLVVLVHGSMDRSAGLLRLSRRLADTYRVLRYDRRGYGRSAGLGPPWTVDANIDDLAALTEQHVADGRRAVVVGHSFGGNVALALAARRRDLVDGVVVYETPMSWLDTWPGNSSGAAAMSAEDAGDAAEAFIRRLVGDEAWERLSTSKQATRRQEGLAMVAELADLRRRAPWSAEEIQVPVLALHGELGRAHHRRAMEALEAMLADGRVASVSGAGHAGPHTHAARVADPIRTFIESLPSSPD